MFNTIDNFDPGKRLRRTRNIITYKGKVLKIDEKIEYLDRDFDNFWRELKTNDVHVDIVNEEDFKYFGINKEDVINV